MIVGASAIQIGTVNFIDPTTGINLLKDLEDYCIKNNINRLSELTGSYVI